MNKGSSKSNIIFAILIVIICFFAVDAFLKNKNSDSNTESKLQIDSQILGNKDDLVFFSVNGGEKVSGAMSLKGTIKGGYFFEANILINILDKDKNILKSGSGNATADWMTSEPVTFEANVDFSGLAKGPAYIEIHNDNASGLAENDKSILIPIIIE